MEEGMLSYPVSPEYVIDHVFSGVDHQHRRVQLPVECADRAVSWIRIQARTYGATAPEDHPIWGWIDSLHRATERELRLTGAAALSFDLDLGHVSWTVRRAAGCSPVADRLPRGHAHIGLQARGGATAEGRRGPGADF